AAAKAASGAMERLFVVEVANLARRLAWLRERGVWLSGGVDDESAIAYTRVDYRGSAAIVVGGEGRGLRRLTRERCDHLVRVPMASAMPSLNVSVALGVLLFEAVRQRAE
ncbi:MAG: 23S rRNA (guanosine(2251)-2'-O)-methyltransferase RlmB, partial [Pseudomonadales bacterium]|nr:23S rRNA (guanosine(2251)-2'-O)-methyltransferase RlmB [Pseudomonadales bacterium]